MINLSGLRNDYEGSGAFHELVNIASTADASTFITKGGDLLKTLALRGVDAECFELEDVSRLTAHIKSALRSFDERFIVTTFVVKRSGPKIPNPPECSGLVSQALTARHRYLSKRALFEIDCFMTITMRSTPKALDRLEALTGLFKDPVAAGRKALGLSSLARHLDEELEAALRSLTHATESFIERLAGAVQARVLSVEQAFQSFRRVMNPHPIKADSVTLARDSALDLLLTDSELECHRSHLRLDDYYVKMLTLKELPSASYAQMLRDLLGIDSEMILTAEWRVLDSATATGRVRALRRHAHNTKVSLFSQVAQERPSERDLLYDDSKEAVVQDLGECLKAIEMKGVRLGEISLTITCLGQTQALAEQAAAEAMKFVGRHDAALNEERYNSLNAMLSSFPGGHPYNLRRLLATDENYADLVPWFLPATGDKRNQFLAADYLAAFESEERTLYYFNAHHGDVAHALVLGATGSGKSFLMNFLSLSVQQYSPYTFILDIGGSYRWLVQALGGAIVSFRSETDAPKINPFCLPPTEANLQFLSAFVTLLLETGGPRLTGSERRDLFDAITAIYVLEPEHRRLLSLSNTLPKPLGNRLRPWTEGEQYGRWFDNPEDQVSFSRLQYFDCEGLERQGPVAEILPFYLLHRLNDIILDPALLTTPKTTIVDELWRFIRETAIRDYILSAMRTWRKKNAAMLLCTQALQDLGSNDVLRPLLDSCPTKLLLSSPNLDAQFYGEALGLNGVELDRIKALTPKKQLLLKQGQTTKVLNLNVDPWSYWLFTTNPFESKRRQELVDERGLIAALDKLAGGE